MAKFSREVRRFGATALPVLGAMLILLANSGCVPLAVGAGAATGAAIAQERSVGSNVDDTTTRLNIEGLLLKEGGNLAEKVGVEVVEGRVLLTGAVRTPDERVKATMVSWRSAGVKEVINEIQVTDKSGLGNLAKDSWITTKLRARILADTKINDINYSIETVNGVIYLIGIAASQQELDKVNNYARNISGVVKVVSYVRVKGNQTAAPARTSAPYNARDDIQGDLLPPGGVPATEMR
ncbi:MAG TPA: BON domain-containing protein [Alphaproteobacteria bacterium]|nr:BON domain-containing protein [Alphaproteobacteria bacterium]